jgi:HPt (histidine-containing phosphotransfer) domain-containing protein
VSVWSVRAASTDREQKLTVIDETHLERMTLGDRRLEREVLELFVRQTTIMLGRIVGADQALAAAAAHTLKGSARGIGAWRVARAAELVESAAGREGGASAMEDAVTELKSASLEASAAIGARLSGLVAELARTR